MRAIRETFQHIVILTGAATKTTQAPLLNVLSFSVTRCVGPKRFYYLEVSSITRYGSKAPFF